MVDFVIYITGFALGVSIGFLIGLFYKRKGDIRAIREIQALRKMLAYLLKGKNVKELCEQMELEVYENYFKEVKNEQCTTYK